MSDAIKDLTEHLASTIKQIDWMGQKIHPVLKKEAKAEDLKKLEKKLGRPVPESYATFLAVANGIDGAESGSVFDEQRVCLEACCTHGRGGDVERRCVAGYCSGR